MGTKIVAQRELAIEFRDRLINQAATHVEETKEIINNVSKTSKAFKDKFKRIMEDPDSHLANVHDSTPSSFTIDETSFRDEVRTAVYSGMREWAASKNDQMNPFDWIINYEPEMWERIIDNIVDSKIPMRQSIVFNHIDYCHSRYKEPISDFVQFFSNGCIAQAKKAYDKELELKDLPKVSLYNWLERKPSEF